MTTRESKNIAEGPSIVPSQQPLSGVDDSPIDIGATEGAQLPEESKPVGVQRKRAAKRGVPLDGDLDDEVTP